MDLTFTSAGYAPRGYSNGVELFSISPSTSRTDEYVTLRALLPGMPVDTRIDAPAGTSKYGREVCHLATIEAAKMLRQWALNVLGVDLSVTVVDKT